jgi:nucleoside-diphosphate kinase
VREVGALPAAAGELGGVVGEVERTLALVKPDGVRRGLSGEVVRRIEAKGYRLVALELRTVARDLLEQHYAEHVGKPFYEPLVAFMSSGPVLAAVVEGHRAVEGWRALMGTTDPTKALPGSIRGDLGRDWGGAVQENLVHGSDSPESAAREIAIWFPTL